MGTRDEILALERAVWEALVAGDTAADAALLEEGFLGVYSTGFSDRAGHAAQLAAGPSVERYEIGEARLLPLSSEVVLLAYRAAFRRPGGPREEMYVSSVWRRHPGGWLNIFSQDTATGEVEPP